jgi:hypothetical protein
MWDLIRASETSPNETDRLSDGGRRDCRKGQAERAGRLLQHGTDAQARLRGDDAALLGGAHCSTMGELAAVTVETDKVLVF